MQHVCLYVLHCILNIYVCVCMYATVLCTHTHVRRRVKNINERFNKGLFDTLGSKNEIHTEIMFTQKKFDCLFVCVCVVVCLYVKIMYNNVLWFQILCFAFISFIFGCLFCIFFWKQTRNETFSFLTLRYVALT